MAGVGKTWGTGWHLGAKGRITCGPKLSGAPRWAQRSQSHVFKDSAGEPPIRQMWRVKRSVVGWAGGDCQSWRSAQQQVQKDAGVRGVLPS